MDFFDSIDAQILGFIQEKISDLEISRNKILTESHGIEAKWKHLEDMIAENSRKLVVDGQAIIEQAKQIKDSYASFDIKAEETKIKVMSGSSWDPSTAAVLRMIIADDSRDVSQQPTLGSLALINNKQFKRNKQVQLSHEQYCMRLIEDDLWVCQSNGMIELFDANLKLKRKLENKAWEYINDIVAVPANDFAVVCSKGIFLIDMYGKDICKIDSGYFYSGVIHKETLFVYEKNRNSILSYTYNGSWQREKHHKTIAWRVEHAERH